MVLGCAFDYDSSAGFKKNQELWASIKEMFVGVFGKISDKYSIKLDDGAKEIKNKAIKVRLEMHFQKIKNAHAWIDKVIPRAEGTSGRSHEEDANWGLSCGIQ